MAAPGSTKVVIAALAFNSLIAATKFIAATWTGSAAMLSEAIHSLVDTSNQALLLHGLKRAGRLPDARHPFGYAKELYFWSLIVAVLLFSLGAGMSIYEGVLKLREPHPVSDPIVNYVVLGLAMLFEGGSTFFAVGEFNARRGETGFVAALRASKDPALFTVLLEDIAALAGLTIALVGIGAAHLLARPAADGLASIGIGLLLAAVAAFMSIETKSLLIGEAASPAIIEGIRAEIDADRAGGGPIERIVALRTMQLGADEVLAAVSLDFRNDTTAGAVERTVARLERAIQRRHPEVRRLVLEARAATEQQEPSPQEPPRAADNLVPASATAPAKEVKDRRRAYPPPKHAKRKRRR